MIEVEKQGIQPRVRYEFRPPGVKVDVRWVVRVDCMAISAGERS